MSFKERQYRERMSHFETPLAEVYNNNAAVARIVQMYARGEIITKEEALCQMVVHLAKDWERESQRAIGYAMMYGPPSPAA